MMRRLMNFLLRAAVLAVIAPAGVLAGGAAADAELLPPELAFKFSAAVRDEHTVSAHFIPAPDYYLYRERIHFAVEAPPGAAIRSVDLPAGEVKKDPLFGATQVLAKSFDGLVQLEFQGEVPRSVRLRTTFQGCNEPHGVCYPPITRSVDLDLASAAKPAIPPAAPAAAEVPAGAAQSLLASGRFWLILASFFGFGLALAFTPCVLPMLPILSGIIVGHGAGLTRVRAVALSAAYVLGMALTYAAAGVVAGLSGTLLSSALQNAWVLGTFAAIFVLLALSMFGLYELQLPARLRNAGARWSDRLPGGRLAGVFLMGALSALIVSPCVAAPLAGALLYIGNSRDIVLGGSALFALALGMGAPLIAVGLSAGSLLPKTGAWMEGVTRFFGAVLIGVAIWIISPVIPVLAQMLAWAGLLIIGAIFLGALDALSADARAPARFAKGFGLMALVAGIALLVGALSGSRDIFQPLAALRGTPPGAETQLVFEPVKSSEDLDLRLAAASADGRAVMLDFYAEWCVSCKEMERFTFSDPRVSELLGEMTLLRADVTQNNPHDQALLKRFSLFGPPGIVFFDSSGKEQTALRVVGYQAADEFVRVLEQLVGAMEETKTAWHGPATNDPTNRHGDASGATFRAAVRASMRAGGAPVSESRRSRTSPSASVSCRGRSGCRRSG